MPPKTPKDLQEKIILALQNGLSCRQVASKYNVSHFLVETLRKKYLPGLKLSVGGRPQKLSPQNKHYCIRSVTSGKIKTAIAVQQDLETNLKVKVDESTIRNILKNGGLEAVKKEKRPRLSEKNIKDRLEFAKYYKDWTVEDWKHVIWSDETKINRFCSDGYSWCWVSDKNNL